MYGDEPDRWHHLSKVRTACALRSTCSRGCDSAPPRSHRFQAEGQARLGVAAVDALVQGVAAAAAGTRIIFGHWSALGYYNADRVVGLDTGCVWGGALTALNLDEPDARPVSVPSRQPRSIGE